ncbi:hypothetical protein HZV92_001835 [Salmonella enterica]|nr:hypothetical protein [Salmonella enterica]EFQ6618174.1 hypothetical protein [Salmonella enterica]
MNTAINVSTSNDVASSFALDKNSAHSQMVRGLAKLGESFKELQIVTQQNSNFDAQNSWEFEKDRFDHKSEAAEAGLKAAKIKAGFSIAGGITSLGMSFGGKYVSKGIMPGARKERREVLDAADGIADPIARQKHMHDNRKILNPHSNLEVLGQNSMPVGNLMNGIGDAASSGVSAEVNRENNAAELDKTLSSISSGDQKSTLDSLQQVKEGFRALKQMIATMQGKMSDAMSSTR